MATSLPLVVSPLRVVLEREGVDVVLVSVEVWPDEVVLRARGLPSERTVALEHAFAEALEAWHQHGKNREPMPEQPAEEILDVEAAVTDDAGTVYSPMGAALGGS